MRCNHRNTCVSKLADTSVILLVYTCNTTHHTPAGQINKLIKTLPPRIDHQTGYMTHQVINL